MVKAIAPDLPRISSDGFASVFVGSEIREEVQAALFEVVADRIWMHAERPRLARPPNCLHYGARTLE
jgi:hypothetical protein